MKKAKKRVAKKVVRPKPKKRVVRDLKVKAWAKKNPWFGENELATALALGTHELLIAESIDPMSDKYYAAIDKRMRQFWKEEKMFPLKYEKQRLLLREQMRDIQKGRELKLQFVIEELDRRNARSKKK